MQPGGKAPWRDSSLESEPTALSTALGRPVPPPPRPQSPRQRLGKGLGMRVGPLGLGSHSASSSVARADCCLRRGLSSSLWGGAGPPHLPCPSRSPVSLAALCPQLAAPHSVHAPGCLLLTVLILGPSVCLCPGSPSPDPGALLQGTTTHTCKGPVSKRGHALRRRRLASQPPSSRHGSAPNIPPASRRGMRQGGTRSAVAMACKACVSGACTLLTDSLPHSLCFLIRVGLRVPLQVSVL